VTGVKGGGGKCTVKERCGRSTNGWTAPQLAGAPSLRTPSLPLARPAPRSAEVDCTAALYSARHRRRGYYRHLGLVSDERHTHGVNSVLHPSAVTKSCTSFGWGKGGNVTSVGWQVTLRDPMRHVSSRSGEASC